jgi:Beta-1,3-glucanase
MTRRMPTSPFPIGARFLIPLASLLAATAALLLPAVASAALQLEIANESGHEDAYVTVAGNPFKVDGNDAEGHPIENNVPAPLGKGVTLAIDELGSGRVYISYGAGVSEPSLPFDSTPRFDWAELTVTPAAGDVANLTAVDQFAIGMRLDTYGPSDEHLEWLGDANSDTIFQALQQIPGGPAATVKNGTEIVRVLSPKLYPSLYPDLGDYVRSMSGKTITLHSYFADKEVQTTSEYSGTFAADGSITLSRDWLDTNNPSAEEGQAHESLTVPGSELIDEIYPAANTPNDLEGEMRHDLFAAFSIGMWGGRYGDDALSFCTTPTTKAGLKGAFCSRFDKPAFGDARLELPPYPTCEQYAAVINQYADSYGNPYSDASKDVAVSLDPARVKTLKLTVLPDSGSAQPKASGNPDCGAGSPAPAPPAAPAAAVVAQTGVHFHLLRHAKVRRGKARVGRVFCSAACGRVRVLARRGKKVLARELVKRSGPKRPLVLRLNRRGRRMVAHRRKLKLRLDVWVTPSGQATRHVRRPLLLVRGARR